MSVTKPFVIKPSVIKPPVGKPPVVKPEEREFTFNGFRYAGQCWGEQGALPILALHGWLDNSASFDVLAPLLQGTQLLALDLAGHGKSDHRLGLSDYAIYSEIPTLFAIADAMGWQQFVLLGHSRGAMMSLLAAATFPERISHLVLIDALAPPPVPASHSIERLISSVNELQRRLQVSPSLFPSYEAAIQARCQSEFGKITPATAERLAVRGLTHSAQGYQWHADGKLWVPSNTGLTPEQLEAFIDNIRAKVLILLGKDGFKRKVLAGSPFADSLSRLVEGLQAELHEYDDGHYLHMESAAKLVAATLQHFLTDSP